jgi:hypothetical protein
LKPREWIEWSIRPDDEFSQLSRVEKPALPSEIASESKGVSAHTVGDLTAWSVVTLGRSPSWFSLHAGADEAPIWRSTRFPVRPMVLRDGNGRDVNWVAVVPQKKAIVCTTIEPALASQLPQRLRESLPSNWNGIERVCTRWHDWIGDEWRDVGCGKDEIPWQIRPNALITNDSAKRPEFVLQSWPLPPRDPKWPALGIGAIATVGTWAFIHWLARRRRRITMPARHP